MDKTAFIKADHKGAVSFGGKDGEYIASARIWNHEQDLNLQIKSFAKSLIYGELFEYDVDKHPLSNVIVGLAKKQWTIGPGDDYNRYMLIKLQGVTKPVVDIIIDNEQCHLETPDGASVVINGLEFQTIKRNY
jgi:hypothetical protein